MKWSVCSFPNLQCPCQVSRSIFCWPHKKTCWSYPPFFTELLFHLLLLTLRCSIWILLLVFSPQFKFHPWTRVSLVAQSVKCLSAMQETRVQFLSQEDPLEKEMAPHSSTLAWKIPWTEKPSRLQSMESQKSDMTERSHFSLSFKFHPRNESLLVVLRINRAQNPPQTIWHDYGPCTHPHVKACKRPFQWCLVAS